MSRKARKGLTELDLEAVDELEKLLKNYREELNRQ